LRFDSKLASARRQRRHSAIPTVCFTWSTTNAVSSLAATNAWVMSVAVGSRLRVWQSPDDHIVAVIAMDSHVASQDSGPSYHFTLSPSPSFCSARACFKSTSLSFSYTLPSPTQDVESWQLLATGESKYFLVLNMGSSVVVMALRLGQVYHQPTQSSQAALPRLHFDHRKSLHAM
jgi:hypothetical protein